MRTLLTLLLLGFLSSWASAAGKLPGYLTLPPAVQVGAVQVEEFGEVDMPLRDSPNTQRGKRWSGDMVLQGIKQDASPAEIWGRIKPALVKGGWEEMMHGGDSWATLRSESVV